MQSKYRAKRTTVDGVTFASQGEARRYQELRLLERAGEIQNLTTQPSFEIHPAFVGSDGKRHRAIRYIADFRYQDRGRDVVEDFKGVETPAFKLKAKMFQRLYPDILFRVTKR